MSHKILIHTGKQASDNSTLCPTHRSQTNRTTSRNGCTTLVNHTRKEMVLVTKISLLTTESISRLTDSARYLVLHSPPPRRRALFVLKSHPATSRNTCVLTSVPCKVLLSVGCLCGNPYLYTGHRLSCTFGTQLDSFLDTFPLGI